MPDGIDAFNQSFLPMTCGDCGVHLQIDPEGDVGNAACPQCGGKRFFRTQPSPVKDDLTGENIMKNMPDAGGGLDTGGNPLQEGAIALASLGPYFAMQLCPQCSGVLLDNATCPNCEAAMPEGTLEPNSNSSNPDLARGIGGAPLTEGTIVGRDDVPSDSAATHQYDGYTHSSLLPRLAWEPPGWALPERQNPQDPYGEVRHGPWRGVWNGGRLMDVYHDESETPMDAIQVGDYDWQHGRLTQHPNQESLQRALQEWANEYGNDYTRNELPYRNSALRAQELTESLFANRQTFRTTPYPALWSDEHVSGITGDPSNAATTLTPEQQTVPGEGEFTNAEDVAKGAASLMRGVGFVTNMFGTGGSQNSGVFPVQVNAPKESSQIPALEATDIPLLLMSNLDMYNSVDSVDEHHDSPEKQDQKEFDNGDTTPSNFHNPNNEDSAADGEDGIRAAEPGYGFSVNTPGMSHLLGALPLLLHYLVNGLDGKDDPILQEVHKKLESEQPGYLDHEHPDGPKIVEIMLKQHAQKDKAKHARVATVPLSPFPTPASDVDTNFTPGSDIQPIQDKSQVCPQCGGVVNGDGTCPHCGFPNAGSGLSVNQPQQLTANTQGPVTAEQYEAAAQFLTQSGQQDLIEQLYEHPENFGWLMDEIRQNPNPTPPLVPPQQQMPAGGGAMMPPSDQGSPDGQMPSPMDQGAPGGMPVIDPSQPGGGGGQPMQPLSALKDYYDIAELRQYLPWDLQAKIDDIVLHEGVQAALRFIRQHTNRKTIDEQYANHPYQNVPPLPEDFIDPVVLSKRADANNRVSRCPKCGSASTSYVDTQDADDSVAKRGHCHSCHYEFTLKEANGSYRLVALVNPQTPRPQPIWVDSNGQALQIGEHYSLYTQGVPVPDEVVVLATKPSEMVLQLVGTNADFRIQADEMLKGKYSLEPPTNTAAGATDGQEVPYGGHPLDNANVIEQPTTDEMTDMYPNTTVSHAQVQAGDDSTCKNCGSKDLHSSMLSPFRILHECYRCGHAWDTLNEEDDYDQQAHKEGAVNPELEWLFSSSDDDFFDAYEQRRAAMTQSPEYGSAAQSRNIHEIAARDPRLGEIRERLNQNPSLNSMMHEAGKNFSASEKRALINEEGMARNFDNLDLSYTHYRIDDEYVARRKGNELDVPDAHLFMGL